MTVTLLSSGINGFDFSGRLTGCRRFVAEMHLTFVVSPSTNLSLRTGDPIMKTAVTAPLCAYNPPCYPSSVIMKSNRLRGTCNRHLQIESCPLYQGLLILIKQVLRNQQAYRTVFHLQIQRQLGQRIAIGPHWLAFSTGIQSFNLHMTCSDGFHIWHFFHNTQR